MIYLFYGEDNFRRQLSVDALKEKLINPEWESTNYVQLQNPSINDCLETCLMPSFGLCERLVLVNDADFLSEKSEDEDVKRFLAEIQDLPEGVSVLFNSKKILGTLKLVKELKKFAEAEEFKEFVPWDVKPVATWLLGIAKKKNIDVDFTALEFMAEYLGAETSKLFSELMRLDVLVSSTKPSKITKELVEKECKPKHDVFKFAEELCAGNKDRANFELDKVIKNGEANIGFLLGLQTNVNRYFKVKLLNQARLSKEEQAKALGVTSGRLYFLQKATERMSINRLETLNNNLSTLESQVKQGKRKVDFALKLLVNI